MSRSNKKYTNEPNKVWRQENNPYRSLTFWGWNEKNEPSFLILYGVHEFAEENSFYDEEREIERFENILEDDVTYTSYVVFDGKGGHLPSFEAVNIVEEGGWQYRDRQDEFPKMYYKKDSRVNGWSRDLKDEGIVKEYVKFEEGTGITIPYFDEMTYSELVELVEDSNINIDNFRFAENPNEILQLSEESKGYFDSLCVMMSDKNLYMRKKKLSELLSLDVDEEIYKCIFKVGSNELLSGLFLEAAKRNINRFSDEAEYIVNNDINYASESYVKGLKRCATIYLNSVNEERKAEREKWIRNNVQKIDLPLIKIDGKEIPKDKKLNGIRYRKLSLQEKLQEFNIRYARNSEGRWETIKTRNDDRYESGPFNDGVIFDIKAFKNVLQEAEAYKMADIIGEIAYYLDAPRLHYYFKGNGLGRELRYFKKYVHRIIKYYGQNDEEKFMEVMKSLFTRYTEEDMLCKFKNNFQFNYFIKNVLYADFKEKPPAGDWYNPAPRFNWMSNDQLLKAEGRYELHKEIWDKHLEDVLYIALNAKIGTVSKACYFILKESDKTDELIGKLDFDEILKLTMAPYKPLADIFKEKLGNKLANEAFDFNIMKSLMNYDELAEVAMNYYKNSNGHITEENIVELMLLDNLEKWSSYIVECINEISVERYLDFVKAMIAANDKFKESNLNLPKEITDALSESVNKVMELSSEEKADFIKCVLSQVVEKRIMERSIEIYLQDVIFALPYLELKGILESEDVKNPAVKLSSGVNRILTIVSSIVEGKIPSDSVIIDILETGTSKEVKTLLEIIDVNEEELKTRFSSMLILLESDVARLNEKAKAIFGDMDEETRVKMHKFIIDSPVEKVYKFGLEKLTEIYGQYIPADFVVQMMEHAAPEVKAYISDKTDIILKTLGEGNETLFIYYAKTLLMLPNRVRKNKDDIYEALYNFALKYEERKGEVEELLLNMGSSNIIKDSEKALVTLAKIRKGAAE